VVNKDTQSNIYKPTASEEKLIEVLCNPEYVGVNISDKCTAAGISRDVYYRAIKKPGFFEYINKLAMDLVKAKMGDIVNLTYKFAQLPKNHQDRKILLEMGGGYMPGIKQEITGKNGESLNVIFNIPRPPKEEKEEGE